MVKTHFSKTSGLTNDMKKILSFLVIAFRQAGFEGWCSEAPAIMPVSPHQQVLAQYKHS